MKLNNLTVIKDVTDQEFAILEVALEIHAVEGDEEAVTVTHVVLPHAQVLLPVHHVVMHTVTMAPVTQPLTCIQRSNHGKA